MGKNDEIELGDMKEHNENIMGSGEDVVSSQHTKQEKRQQFNKEFKPGFDRIGDPWGTFCDKEGWGWVRISWVVLAPICLAVFFGGLAEDSDSLDYVGAILFFIVSLYSLVLSWRYYTDWRKCKAIKQMFMLQETSANIGESVRGGIKSLQRQRQSLLEQTKELDEYNDRLRVTRTHLGKGVKDLESTEEKTKQLIKAELESSNLREDDYNTKLHRIIDNIKDSSHATLKNLNTTMHELLVHICKHDKVDKKMYAEFVSKLAKDETAILDPITKAHIKKKGFMKWTDGNSSVLQKTIKHKTMKWLEEVHEASIKKKISQLLAKHEKIEKLAKELEDDLQTLQNPPEPEQKAG
mmetsp:Transcript_20681/g.36747  ORF Transcript_20681/g.36747 Transcript_20681/m.36747 type:complete len:352 (-) Transcript_20681:253-1308(-)|eukprot:CAMPEP_0197518060 /NCGR_PEP_ID=MMETSP1318-20131121/3177_1 /TAXON_ID=552666 /ORGANISM="Partenskyella glossopodia, Strain RCC365" /LENGTH=351 /DNA_ID=CAMNT_0043068111 /DNA_START=145 /DNA_END=1200 /DNA_ORIENTATION=-